jgi:hypothetical protein
MVESTPDKQIGKTMNGKPIYSKELLVLSQLLTHSIFDADRGHWPHLLNAGKKSTRRVIFAKSY